MGFRLVDAPVAPLDGPYARGRLDGRTRREVAHARHREVTVEMERGDQTGKRGVRGAQPKAAEIAPSHGWCAPLSNIAGTCEPRLVRVRIVGGTGSPWDGDVRVSTSAIWLDGTPYCLLDDLSGIVTRGVTKQPMPTEIGTVVARGTCTRWEQTRDCEECELPTVGVQGTVAPRGPGEPSEPGERHYLPSAPPPRTALAPDHRKCQVRLGSAGDPAKVAATMRELDEALRRPSDSPSLEETGGRGLTPPPRDDPSIRSSVWSGERAQREAVQGARPHTARDSARLATRIAVSIRAVYQ
jgi:hypothetical protein